ncbi:hypothetical protein HMSSN036_77160 [Paenibacillus macerans]|nr:hypothetical protein HMSSN036_77160 [Paenibacillus macerans]
MDSYGLWAVIAIGLASNLDNAGVGIAYGVRKIHIPWYSNLAISFISFLATLVSGLFGSWLSLWFHPWIGQILGTLVIVGVGVWVLLQPFIEKNRCPRQTEQIRLPGCCAIPRKPIQTVPNRSAWGNRSCWGSL